VEVRLRPHFGHHDGVSFLYNPAAIVSHIDLYPLLLLVWSVSCTAALVAKKVNGVSVRKLIAVLLILGWTGAAGAATLQYSNGFLVGVTELEVGNSLYNVTFSSLTCVEIFNGCDEATDFAITDSTEAQLAAASLLRQVFYDGSTLGFFPSMTNGCENATSFGCRMVIPYAFGNTSDEVLTIFAENEKGGYTDSIGSWVIFQNQVLGAGNSWSDATFAAFVPSAVPTPEVPIPAAAWLFGSALCGLVAVARRKRK